MSSIVVIIAITAGVPLLTVLLLNIKDVRDLRSDLHKELADLRAQQYKETLGIYERLRNVERREFNR